MFDLTYYQNIIDCKNIVMIPDYNFYFAVKAKNVNHVLKKILQLLPSTSKSDTFNLRQINFNGIKSQDSISYINEKRDQIITEPCETIYIMELGCEELHLDENDSPTSFLQGYLDLWFGKNITCLYAY